jgi:hypothetical protein
MLVLVRYTDDNYDIVEEYCLEYLIMTGKVAEFSRSDEWVTVGDTPTRENPRHSAGIHSFNGPERRKQFRRNILLPLSPTSTTN